MKIEDVCKQELQRRIKAIETLLASAKDCLKENDFFQCAVRLEEMKGVGTFDETLLNVFDSISGV